MKKNLLKIGSIVVAATLISTCFLGSSLAKYTTTVSGNDSATVAKWGWEINEIALTKERDSYTFDLFNTIEDTNGQNEDAVVAEKIAPGTKGAFELKIDNVSDVDATYAINFTATNVDFIPIKYSLDETNWETSISELDISATAIAKTNGTATVKVYWKWDFEGNEVGDTVLGLDGTASVTVTAAAIFTQVDRVAVEIPK